MNAVRRRWVMVAAAVIAGGAVAAVTVILATGGDTPASPGSPTPGPSPTETATVSPTVAPATPTPTATPEPSDMERAIRDALELKVGMRGHIGDETVAYYNVVPCYACGTGPGLWRAFAMPRSGGELITEQLLDPSEFGGGYVSQLAADWERGELVAAICVEGYCGGEGEPEPGSRNILLRSRDGGVTWSELGTLRVGAAIAFVRDGRIVVAEGFGTGACLRLSDFMTGEPVGPPVAGTGGQTCWYAITVDGEGLVWEEGDTSRAFNERGDQVMRRLFVPDDRDYPWQQRYAARDRATGERYVMWWKDGYYLSALRPGGELRSTWAFPAHFWVRGSLGNGRLYGNVELPQRFCGRPGDCRTDPAHVSYEAAIIDLNTSTIHPFDQLTERLRITEHPVLMHLAVGRFAVVSGTGDCLNVRAAPGAAAEVLDCYADGVLLRTSGEVADADGRGWLSVVTPDGRPGFAATGFLEW